MHDNISNCFYNALGLTDPDEKHDLDKDIEIALSTYEVGQGHRFAMKIGEYLFHDVEAPGWEFDPVVFKKLNLLVGNTATGKTRMLNTIFSLGSFVASKQFKLGSWRLAFEHAGIEYEWAITTQSKDSSDSEGNIEEERLVKYENGEQVILVERSKNNFLFQHKELPKLALDETSISLLREEDVIRPIYEAFSMIMRRRFFHDALAKVSELQSIPTALINDLEKSRKMDIVFKANMNLNATLFLLEKYFSSEYRRIVDKYLEVFPFLKEAKIKDLSDIAPGIATSSPVPVFSVREQSSINWIPVIELSSGMQKVLLILTDLSILPNGGVYLIDEYENSLGQNAIEFLPSYLEEFDREIQFFITSHHPFLINAIPIKDWYVFHREGMKVKIRYGKELEERFGKSRQQAFIQLINDPFFAEGVE